MTLKSLEGVTGDIFSASSRKPKSAELKESYWIYVGIFLKWPHVGFSVSPVSEKSPTIPLDLHFSTNCILFTLVSVQLAASMFACGTAFFLRRRCLYQSSNYLCQRNQSPGAQEGRRLTVTNELTLIIEPILHTQ